MTAGEDRPARKLILVRHSLPEVVASLPAAQWQLSEEGERRCRVLAHLLERYDPAAILSSEESRARQTAELVSGHLGKTCETVSGLHEHDRSNVPYMSRAAFESAIQRSFERPDALLLGTETAQQARLRFEGAINHIVERFPGGNLVVVTHGTVIALFVAGCGGGAPYALWRRLGMPSFVILSLPDLEFSRLVDQIE